jgi:hypothetical protein
MNTVINGTPALTAGASSFKLIKSLWRNDSDTTLVFLSGNGVLHTQPTDDKWYQTAAAGSTIGFGTADPTLNSSKLLYTLSEPAPPLGCTEQHQFCNNAFPGPTGCGKLASLQDSIRTAAPFFNSSYKD